MAEVGVHPIVGGWAAVCSVHGHIAAWQDPGLAGWCAIAHATAHHHG